MRHEDEILLNTADELLHPMARHRKHTLQQQIAARAKLRAPLLTSSDKPGPKQSESLAADQITPWKTHERSIRQARAASNTQAERVERNAKQHEGWNHQAGTPTTASGVKLDPTTAELKKASDASRAAAKQPPRMINLSTLRVCVWAVMQTHAAEFFDSTFDAEALNRLVQKQLQNGAEVCPETIEAAYQEGLANNNFEQIYRRDPVTGGRISKRGASLQPPTLPPAVVWPDEAALLEREAQAEALRLDSEEGQRALHLTFAELQAKVRANFKRGGDEAVQ